MNSLKMEERYQEWLLYEGVTGLCNLQTNLSTKQEITVIPLPPVLLMIAPPRDDEFLATAIDITESFSIPVNLIESNRSNPFFRNFVLASSVMILDT